MRTLIVTVQGATVHHMGGQIVVQSDGQTIARLPDMRIERALFFGAVAPTIGFLNFAFARRIPVTFLTVDGAYKGRLETDSRRDIAIRLAQYRRLEDTAWRVEVARSIVLAKIAGQRALLMRYARNHASPELAEASDAMAAIARDVERMAQTADATGRHPLPRLMGLEGAAAKVYFGGLPHALRRPVPFRGRSRRPPRDPVNALLSLGYTLLTAEIIGALTGLGLDPQIGVFHSSRGRVPALAEDLLEVFRAPVADAVALSLINLGALQADDFVLQEDGGFRLKKEKLAVYFTRFRDRMNSRLSARDGGPTSFRKELQRMASNMRASIMGDGEFVPYRAPSGGLRANLLRCDDDPEAPGQ